MTFDSTTLKYSTYAIAVFDLLSAMLIIVEAIKTLLTGFNWSGWFLLLFAIFWSSVVVLLLVGIWKRRPKFVQAWIWFSCVGIFIEMFLILFGIVENATINWERMKGAIILFVGVESIFVYIVYKFYKTLQKTCPKKKQRCACFKRKSAASRTEGQHSAHAKKSKSKKKDEKRAQKKPTKK